MDTIMRQVNKRSKTGPIKVYCRKCKLLIAEIDDIMSPDRFKFLYGETCLNCGSKLQRFKVKKD